MKIKMTSIPVNSPNDAHKFYTEVLGFQTHTHMPDHQLAIVVSPEDPKGTALLLEPNQGLNYKELQEAAFKAGLPIIVMGVENVQETYEELKAKGVVFTKEPVKTDWGTLAMFEDTCGNIIQIHQD